MTITGTVKNGAIIPDEAPPWPEGARISMSLAEDEPDDRDDFDPSSLPPDHPMAPYDREVELALLRESIAETEAGYPGRPLEEVMAEIALKYNLPPLVGDRS